MNDQEAEKMQNMAGMILMLSMMFIALGLILEITAYIQEFAKFAPLQTRYWAIDKAARDTTTTSSQLSIQLVQIKKFTPKLMLFKLT
jgi:flagellar biogenesis protein FliO